MDKLPSYTHNFSEWYLEVIYQAELADQAPVKGCMVIRPYGYALWENMKAVLDKRIKETGHQNASFPLLIPESFITREAKHVEGFAPELAVVTHAGGKKLEENLVVRPTSETMIHYMFARWISSWRDLPLKINQWANVVRWEMRTRPFLRTTEFLWQEGHTAHQTYQEAEQETLAMMREYVSFVRDYLAIPAITGHKPEMEKFPGAEITLTFESLMPDGKALQMGTSHLLSQNFARSFEMSYQDQEGQQAYPYLTSWGVTTRLIGALVMMHGDEKGLIMPPRIAPIQVVILPILKKGGDNQKVFDAIQSLKNSLKEVRVEVDDDDTKTPGAKFYKWELKGVPLRIEIGSRDVEQNCVVVVNRLTGEKTKVACAEIGNYVTAALHDMHTALLIRAQERQDAMTFAEKKLTQFGPLFETKPGFYRTGWCGGLECEAMLKEYKATIRCLVSRKTFVTCFYCDKESVDDVLVAKSY